MDKPFSLWRLRWLLAGFGLVALGLGMYGVSHLQPAPENSDPTPVPSGLAAQATIYALGRIEPANEVVTVSGPTGERVGRLFVQEGDWVKAGDPIAYLEAYGERLADRNLAASQLEEARLRLASETRLGNAQIAEAQSRLEQVRDPQEAAIAAQKAEVVAQKATIDRLQTELEFAYRDRDRFARLAQDGAISQKEFDDIALVAQSKAEELAAAQATLAKQQATLSQLVQQQRRDRQNAQAQVQSAIAQREQAQTQVQLPSARDNLELAQARLERTIIRAPASGQILDVLTQAGEAIPSEGGIVALGNTAQMYAVAEVYETDAPWVQVGQAATITSPALDQPLGGVVDRVGLLVDQNRILNPNPAADTDTRVVEVRIRLNPNPVVAKLTNLKVEVAIQPRSP